jgi:6-pyruvoyltetrahydropterin/6-carboxytetrahydropterin synthase
MNTIIKNMKFKSTKILELGSCAFRQPNAANNRCDAGENSKRCSFIHGYKLTAKFWFGCRYLDDKNWVQDFGAFKEIKEIFKNQFDHTTCLSWDDPLLPLFQQIHDAGGLDLRIMPKGTGIERIAEFCFEKMQEFIHKQSNGRVWVESVEVFEHESNSASYGIDDDTVITNSNQLNVSQLTPVELNSLSVKSDLKPLDVTESVLLNLPIQPLSTEVIQSLISQASIQTSPGLQSNAAPVGQLPTSGMSGLFGGTRFG